MFKKIQYAITVLGLPLSLFITMVTNAIAAPPCDARFTITPTFSCLAAYPQTGVYTITNNTTDTLAIGTPSFTSDAQPASNTTISANTCSSLAAGASCNISVTLSAAGPYTRVLHVPVDSRQVAIDSSVVTPTTGCSAPPTPAPLPASFTAVCPSGLGSTSTFGVLANSTITNTGGTVINGDLGLSPGTSVTGFPPGVVTGTQNITDATAAAAQVSLTTLYNCLAAQTCGTTIGTGDQAGITRTSSGTGAVNVYCSGSSILNSGVLTLNGDSTSVFIFQAGSTLTMGVGSSIVLTGGLTAANVFWQVGSSATLNSGTVFQGTIAAQDSITLGTGATIITGRALARTAAVTLDTNTITVP